MRKYFNITILGFCLTILNFSYAQAQDEILISGKGEGIYCGQEVGDYIHTCVVQNNQKRYMMGTSHNAAEAAALEKIPLDTPVTFEFEVVKTFMEEGDIEMVIVSLISMKAR